MSPGFKYHIVSISAIFFALTIGLVVGSVFVSPTIANRQEHLISRLQTTLNNDVEEKRKELQQYRECVAAIAPLALSGRLRQVVVAIVQVGDYPDLAAQISDAVAQGSPRGIVHLTITPALDRTDEDLNRTLTADPQFPADRASLIRSLAGLVVRGDTAGGGMLPHYESAGIVRLTSDDSYTQQVGVVILVGGTRSADSMRSARVDVPLIKDIQKLGAAVVACEPRDAPLSDMPAYRGLRSGISTVDNADTDIGQCAVVLACAGGRGDYGVKPGAEHLLPPPVNEQQ